MKTGAIFAVLASISGTALAQDAPDPDDQPPLVDAPTPAVQPPPQPTVVVPRDWRGVFDAIDRGEWASAGAGIAALPSRVLASLAKAELYTARNSPAVDLNALQALIAEAPELPQASQLAAMAVNRGATTAPLILVPRRTAGLGSAPVRVRARSVSGDPAADQLRPILDQLVKVDDAAGAEAQLLTFAPSLTAEGRAEAGQRVAFIYYIRGLDLDARRVADTWRQGATGDWAAQSAWTSGLASWRMSDFNTASQAFLQAARLSTQRELRAGGYYWAARSEQAAGRPRSVTPLLRYAAESAESFYGLVARETLGMETKLPRDPFIGFDPPVDQLPNVRRATELVRIGRHTLAEELLRHQAKVGLPTEHHALIQVAKRLDLPAAQLWLANNGQPGARSDAADRYPNPRWTPPGGWRVDPALAFGHVIQESSFRRSAVSPVGAVGLMQVRPGTAGDFARARGTPLGPLTDVSMNLEYGQSFIELMRRSPGTAGQLPRVIASYNAGPVPVSRWATINDKGDPLLWIESIPYWETRYYVPSILRNMWVYQGLNNRETLTLREIAQHRWPAFPQGVGTLAH
ncbi:MAG: lytic transglycosylase domain-containing protein [Sphingomicrobium sp.]